MEAGPRIVHVINRMTWGGAENQLRGIVARSSLQHEIVELQDAHGNARLRNIRRLRDTLRRLRPDVAVAWLDRAQVATAIAAGRSTVLVARIAGRPGRSALPQRLALRAAFARYDAFVTNSNASREATRRFARPLRLRRFDVITNAVEIPDSPSPPPRAHGTPRIAFVGRNDPAKGLDVLLTALGELSGEGVRAVLIGRGVPEAVAAWPGPLPPCETHDRVPDPWSAVGRAAVLAVPSRSEGLPNVVSEAFARRIPVVATAVGGTPELVAPERGVLIPPEDPGRLAAALRCTVARADEARARADRARRWVEQEQSWPSVVRRWDEFLTATAILRR